MHPQASRVGPLIAIIEDHAPTRDLLYELLTEEGYQTLCCATASEAHRRIRHEKPDLLMLDLHLEGWESGLKVLDILRRIPATSTLPILVCSADTTLLKEQADEFARTQCEVLAKPFDLDALLDTVRAMLDRSRQTGSYSLVARTSPVTLCAAKLLS
jgi:DNA-binding response OmpR family regulator